MAHALHTGGHDIPLDCSTRRRLLLSLLPKPARQDGAPPLPGLGDPANYVTPPPDSRPLDSPDNPGSIIAAILAGQQQQTRLLAQLLQAKSHTPPDAEDTPALATAHAPSNPGSNPISAATPPAGADLAAVATTIANAIADSLGATSSATADSSPSDQLTLQRLKRTHPALVDPRQHDGDAHKLGLIIRRMTAIDMAEGQGLSAILWKRSCDAKATALHAQIHAAAPSASYAEGEAAFFAYVSEVITLAAQFETGASQHLQHRQKQLLWWMQVWSDFRQNLRDATRHWRAPEAAYRMQMEDLMTTALGVGLSNAQLKNLKTTAKLRSDLGGALAPALPLATPPPATFRQPKLLTPPPALHPPTLTPAAPPQPKPTLRPRYGPRLVGQHMPQAQDILGTDVPGTLPFSSACNECGGKHRPFECPKLFAKEHPGKTMPGFDANGNRIPSAWSGDKITAATRQQWLRMQTLGFFTQPPDRGDPASMPALH